MVIPMGTVVTVCMIVCIIFSIRVPVGGLNARTPPVLLRFIGFVTGAAGLWNILWYAVRNFTDVWGQMAFGSGLLLCALSALLILGPVKAPASLEKMRHVLALALAIFTALYTWKIYRL